MSGLNGVRFDMVRARRNAQMHLSGRMTFLDRDDLRSLAGAGKFVARSTFAASEGRYPIDEVVYYVNVAFLEDLKV